MSGNTILAPREDSDSAIDREARGAAGGGVDRYRTWVSDHRASAALLAAVVATHLATVIGYFMPGIGLPQLDWNRINGAIYTPKASPDVQFLSGGVFHYVDGIVFTPPTSGSSATTSAGSWCWPCTCGTGCTD